MAVFIPELVTMLKQDLNATSQEPAVGTPIYNPAIELLRTEKFQTKKEALKRERQIKGWRREKKLNLI